MEAIETNETPKAPPVKRKKRARAKRTAAPRQPKAPEPAADSKWAGATRTACPSGCTGEHCLVSTVNVCKHPYMNGDAGCGPITRANREELKRYLKHQDVDRRG